LPCPWYRDGMCTSPALETATDLVVSPQRCLSDDQYRSCAYYVDPAKLQEQRKKKPEYVRTKPCIVISGMTKEPKIGCEYAAVEKTEDGFFVVYCMVRGTYLTRWDVELCEKYWKECPFRHLEKKFSE